MSLEILDVHFDFAGSQNLGGGGECLSLWRCARFRARRSLFVAGARETLCFCGLTSTFRDRCKGSEWFTEMQISWQAQRFGHGGDRQGVLISRQVQ